MTPISIATLLRSRLLVSALFLLCVCSACGQRVNPNAARGVANALKRIIVSPQTEEQFVNVFKHAPTQQQLNVLGKVAGKIETQQTYYMLLNTIGTKTVREQLIDQLATSSENLVSIVGHNEEGVLYFPDKSSATFSELIEAGRDKIIVFISCKAAEYINANAAGPLQEISLDAGVDIEREFHRLAQQATSALTLGDTQRILADAQDNVATKRGVKLAAKVSVIAVPGAAGLVRLQSNGR